MQRHSLDLNLWVDRALQASALEIEGDQKNEVSSGFQVEIIGVFNHR